MKKVITYGTFDVLHGGHVKLLERAKALGDYLIVGVTSDAYDRSRGKINVSQSLEVRMENVRELGLADEIIVEEYEGQKIDDILRKNIDIFTVGSDWVGKFDYLNEFCTVIYLDRTQGISSTIVRSKSADLKLGLVGTNSALLKVLKESQYVNGLSIPVLWTSQPENLLEPLKEMYHEQKYDSFLKQVDAVYINSLPHDHEWQIEAALQAGKHVLCGSPLTLSKEKTKQLYQLAKDKNLVLMPANKTAYIIAYNRMILLMKSCHIGEVVSINATCTSLASRYSNSPDAQWGSLFDLGTSAILPVFQLFGVNPLQTQIITLLENGTSLQDAFTQINFIYPKGTATVRVGKGVKSEGELIITGTQGYVVVPSPWWKNDYFEIRYEDPRKNKRFFFAQEGEGIRDELVRFIQNVFQSIDHFNMSEETQEKICELMGRFWKQEDIILLDSKNPNEY